MIFPRNFPVTAKILSRVPRPVAEKCFNFLKNPRQIPSMIWGDTHLSSPSKTQLSPLTKEVCAEYSPATSHIINKTLLEYPSRPRTSQLNRASQILLESGNLASTKYHIPLLASTIVGQGKTYRQAQIDVAELIDFWNFNAYYIQKLKDEQPLYPLSEAECGVFRNSIEYLPLDGLTVAITPFNFTAIGGNLASLPAVLGNPTVWKPSDNSVLSNYIVYEILMEAGLNPKLLSFLPSEKDDFSKVLKHRDLIGLSYQMASKQLGYLEPQVN